MSLIAIKFSENPYKPVMGGYVNFQSHIELFLTCIWKSHGTFKILFRPVPIELLFVHTNVACALGPSVNTFCIFHIFRIENF
jgi:hypothetical protein